MCQPTEMEKRHALTTWRKSQKMTQDELATKLGISRWFVNRLEIGERTPSLDLALKIQEMSRSAVKPSDFTKKERAQA